jgi:chromosome segregation ATPase
VDVRAELAAAQRSFTSDKEILSTKITTLNGQIHALELEVNIFRESTADSNDQVESVQGQLDSLMDKLACSEDERNSLEKQLSDETKQCEKLNDSYNNAELTCKELESELCALRMQQQSRECAYKSLKGRLDTSEANRVR